MCLREVRLCHKRKPQGNHFGAGFSSCCLLLLLHEKTPPGQEEPTAAPDESQTTMQEQQGGDASVDNEVMAILSSPVQQKKIVVKPQPRPGGAAVAATAGGPTGRALGPASPRANGNASFIPNSAAALGSEYLRDTAATATGCSGTVEEIFAGGGAAVGGAVDAAGLPIAPSPPRTPGLPKSTSASWDPQVQSSSSAFSVPAGRGGGGGGGGRVEGAGGAGGTVGGAGIGSLSLGGFRSVGGNHFQVWMEAQVGCRWGGGCIGGRA